MTIEQVRSISARLNQSTAALAALGLALNAQANRVPLDQVITAELYEVLDALGGPGILDDVNPAELQPIIAEIRMTLLHGAKLLLGPTAAGWAHTEAEILRSTGEANARLPTLLKQLMPSYDGLAERLESPDARFLDVGVGVAAISIAMARAWPLLRVVGIDLWRPSLAIARENVNVAGLEDRIELREQSVQNLSDSQVFDLAFFPSFFIGKSIINAALERVYRALRPGGWISFPLQNQGADPLTGSLARLRTVLWGGYPWSPDAAEALLRQTGFVQVQTPLNKPTVPVVMVIGRRPLS